MNTEQQNSTKAVAAIGAGAWGKNIVRTLNHIGALRVIVEASSALRSSIASDYPDVEVMADYEAMLRRDDVHAVTIATPVPTHHAIAKACLLADKDVFVEKPMTLTTAEAEDLVTLAAERGRILMVGHLLLYKPAVQFIREYLHQGKLGTVFTLHQERMKLGRARAVENALWSLGVHDVAALLYIVGATPSKVTFSGHAGLQQGVEDDCYLHLEFSDGRSAHLHNSWLWPEDRRGLVVTGSLGMLVYNEKSETVSLVKKQIDANLNNVDHGVEVLFEAPKEFQALEAELNHFLECVATRSQPRSCGRNGLKVIRVLEQAAI